MRIGRTPSLPVSSTSGSTSGYDEMCKPHKENSFLFLQTECGQSNPEVNSQHFVFHSELNIIL